MAGLDDILGTGLLAPFRRGPNDFVAGSGVENLQSMIGQVLGTRSGTETVHGELPWRSGFGSRLHHLRGRNNDAVTAELARIHVADALARWIPQIRVKTVRIEKKTGPTGDRNVLLVVVRYDVVGLKRGSEVRLADQTAAVELVE